MITPEGSLGTANYRNTSRDAPVAISRDVAVGQWIVVWWATPNIYDPGLPTNGYNRPVCIDDKGNIYSLIGSNTNTDGDPTHGSMVQMFLCEVTIALDSGDVITPSIGAHFPGTNMSRGVSVEEFSVHPSNRLAVRGTGWTTAGINGPSEPPAIGASFPGPDREVLFLHAIGFQGPVTDSFTWDADYTQITAAGTNTGTPTDDITVRGGYRIAELTSNSDTIDVSDTTALRPNVQITTSLCEVLKPEAFPTTPILDDFNRADETPLNNGTWDTTQTAFGGNLLDLVSLEARGSGGSQWLDEMEGCLEEYGTITDVASSVMHYNASGNAAAANFQGNGMQWLDPTIRVLEAWNITMNFSANQGEVNVGVINVFAAGLYPNAPPDGTKLGVRRLQQNTVWFDHLFMDFDGASGWSCIATIALFVTPTAGRFAIGTNGAWDDFGGGEISCIVGGRPQIMRYK